MSPVEPPVADDPTGDPIACDDVRRAVVALAVRSQAVGALMGELGISVDAARLRLAERARDAGLPVDSVAHDVVARYAGPSPDQPNEPGQTR